MLYTRSICLHAGSSSFQGSFARWFVCQPIHTEFVRMTMPQKASKFWSRTILSRNPRCFLFSMLCSFETLLPSCDKASAASLACFSQVRDSLEAILSDSRWPCPPVASSPGNLSVLRPSHLGRVALLAHEHPPADLLGDSSWTPAMSAIRAGQGSGGGSGRHSVWVGIACMSREATECLGRGEEWLSESGSRTLPQTLSTP
mmetsp:Transcript_51135/g.144020  ORF Transcript_51135/g.144020 Transcript_51135/m.144020 type:complete len:201 (+) Transcript_51135:1421-2023(+)